MGLSLGKNRKLSIYLFGRTRFRFGSWFGFTTRAVLVSSVDRHERTKAGFARYRLALRRGGEAYRYRGRTPSRLIHSWVIIILHWEKGCSLPPPQKNKQNKQRINWGNNKRKNERERGRDIKLDDPLGHWRGQTKWRTRRQSKSTKDFRFFHLPTRSISRVTRVQSPQDLHQVISGLTSAQAHDTITDRSTSLATHSVRGTEIAVDPSSSKLIKTMGPSLFQTGRGGINTTHFLLWKI